MTYQESRIEMPGEIRFLEPYQAYSLQVILSSFQSVIRIIQGRISFSVYSTLNRLVLLGIVKEGGKSAATPQIPRCKVV